MLVKEQILDITKLYFDAFENKDLEQLSQLFADDITLFDPIIKEVKSRTKVLAANKNIFDSVQKIKFIYKRICVDQYSDTAIGELKIDFDGKLIEVVDIIEFNEDQKISKITAYLDSASVK